MYAIVLTFKILDAGGVPSAESLAATIRSPGDGGGRVEHVRAERRSGRVVAIAFVTADDQAGALDLGQQAAHAIELSTLSLRFDSIRMLDRPPGTVR